MWSVVGVLLTGALLVGTFRGVRWFDDWSHAAIEKAAYAEDTHRSHIEVMRVHGRGLMEQRAWREWQRKRDRRPVAARARVLTEQKPVRRVAGCR